VFWPSRPFLVHLGLAPVSLVVWVWRFAGSLGLVPLLYFLCVRRLFCCLDGLCFASGLCFSFVYPFAFLLVVVLLGWLGFVFGLGFDLSGARGRVCRCLTWFRLSFLGVALCLCSFLLRRFGFDRLSAVRFCVPVLWRVCFSGPVFLCWFLLGWFFGPSGFLYSFAPGLVVGRRCGCVVCGVAVLFFFFCVWWRSCCFVVLAVLFQGGAAVVGPPPVLVFSFTGSLLRARLRSVLFTSVFLFSAGVVCCESLAGRS